MRVTRVSPRLAFLFAGLLASVASAAQDASLAQALSVSSGSDVMDAAVLYESCRAYALRRPGACSALRPYRMGIRYVQSDKAGLDRPDTYDFLCLSDYYDLTMARAGIASDDAGMAQACVQHEDIGHHDFKPGSMQRACALLAREAPDPGKACLDLGPFYAREASRRYCRAELMQFEGFPGACDEKTEDAVGSEVCDASVDFRDAFARKDPARCGDSILCRVMMGGGSGLCEPYLEETRRFACVASASGKPCPGTPLDALRLEEADVLLRQAGDFLDDLERWGAAASPSACRESFKPAMLVKVFAERRLPREASDALFRVEQHDLERYYSCKAESGEGPRACEPLASFDAQIPREAGVRPIAFDLLCKTLYYEADIAKAMVRDPAQAAPICVKRNIIGDRDFKLDSLQRSCAIVARYRGDPAETCGELIPFFDNTSIAKTCPRMLRFVSGDESVCPQFHDPMVHDRCEGYAAYRKALDARDASRCGPSQYCRTLMGGGAATCEPYAARLGDGFCGFYAAPGLPRAVQPLLERAAFLLRRYDPRGLDGRRGRLLQALEIRWRAL